MPDVDRILADYRAEVEADAAAVLSPAAALRIPRPGVRVCSWCGDELPAAVRVGRFCPLPATCTADYARAVAAWRQFEVVEWPGT